MAADTCSQLYVNLVHHMQMLHNVADQYTNRSDIPIAACTLLWQKQSVLSAETFSVVCHEELVLPPYWAKQPLVAI